PDDGRHMGLQGMINDLLSKCDFASGKLLNGEVSKLTGMSKAAIASMISSIENYPEENKAIIETIAGTAANAQVPVLGITGTGGSGKSSMVDEIVRRFIIDFTDKKIAIVSVDPSKRKTGGALLGDRIRMNAINNDRVYMRSLATRQSNLALSRYVKDTVNILKAGGYDLIILETSGIGQSDTEIIDHSNVALYVMTPEYGAASQLEKIDMLDFADVIAINKFDKKGALDALRDVKKQYQRNHDLWDKDADTMPVYGTIASQFNDPGTNRLYAHIIRLLNEKCHAGFDSRLFVEEAESEKIYIIPPQRVRYLSEISENNRKYDQWLQEQSQLASRIYALEKVVQEKQLTGIGELTTLAGKLRQDLDGEGLRSLEAWPEKVKAYTGDEYIYEVRGKKLSEPTFTTSLSKNKIPRVCLPKFQDWGDLLRWMGQENVPGEFPYTAGVFPFKRKGEDPTRMFAGEGCPERTNKRFHYVSLDMPAKRLSTAFDSVTLYGEDPDHRPDIYGKIGNSGVSVCCLDDAKKLYSGFDLCDPATSVSMTINGPAA
ncbi:MAG TPA: methylmalonyl-CoA mutase family protein, partial [Saprospiraceae bacterium]|nr:methylmalonyl-CoA mutase family protein [Saprospiraceae bacterium]